MNRLRDKLLVGGALALVAASFAWLNGGVSVDVNLGLVRLSDVALPVVVFVAFLLGMLTLFLAGLKAELRTQRMLRRYRELLGADGAPGSEPDPASSIDPPADRATSRTGRDPAADEARPGPSAGF